MAIDLPAFLAMASADRVTYFHDTLMESELRALRQAARASGVGYNEILIAEAMDGAMAIVKSAADAAATSASNSVYATYYARLAAG